MVFGIYISLILTVITLIYALCAAPFAPSSVLPRPEGFRAGSDVVSLNVSIRGVCEPRAGGLPHKAPVREKSCIARATATHGKVYGLAASGMAHTAEPENENSIGGSEANKKSKFAYCGYLTGKKPAGTGNLGQFCLWAKIFNQKTIRYEKYS